MNIPLRFLAFGGLKTKASIEAQVNAIAQERGLTLYTVATTRYRFEGWGLVFNPLPKLACNVKYLQDDGSLLDLGRIVA